MPSSQTHTPDRVHVCVTVRDGRGGDGGGYSLVRWVRTLPRHGFPRVHPLQAELGALKVGRAPLHCSGARARTRYVITGPEQNLSRQRTVQLSKAVQD